MASDIQSPPKTKVADLYQNKDKPSFLFYTDMGKRTVVRMSSNGTKEPAVRLRPGAAGFLVAIYEDGMEHESELPNSVGKEPSQPVVKAGSKKRPAAAVCLLLFQQLLWRQRLLLWRQLLWLLLEILSNANISLSTEVVPILQQFAKWSKLNVDHLRKDK